MKGLCNHAKDNWVVLQRKCNYSAFNGYHYTPSAYSTVKCNFCGAVWRTKAAYVGDLLDDGVVTASCPQGCTEGDLERIFPGDERKEFGHWMRGQTVGYCNGHAWNYDKHRDEPTACINTPHGMVTYTSDVERYLRYRKNWR